MPLFARAVTPQVSLHPQTGYPFLKSASQVASQMEVQSRQARSPQVVLESPETLAAGQISQHLKQDRDGEDLPGLLSVPENPIVETSKDFIRSEMFALGLNSAATWGMQFFNSDPLVLSLIGPVIEKFGFFANEIYKEVKDPSTHLSFSERMRKMFRGAARNLMIDIAFHDTVYSALMFASLNYEVVDIKYAPILSAVNFGFAAFVAPALQVGTEKLSLALSKSFFGVKGMQDEKYVESRYLLNENADAEEIMNQLIQEFNLGEVTKNIYEDQYYIPQMDELAGQKILVREREIWNESGEEHYHSNMEVIFTEISRQRSEGEYNFFKTAKHKLWIPASVQDSVVGKGGLNRLKGEKVDKIAFLRHQAFNDDLRVTVDTIFLEDGKAVYVLELKVYPGKEDKLYEALEFLKDSFGVKATTLGKSDLMTVVKAL